MNEGLRIGYDHIEIKEVRAFRSGMLLLTFNNGEKRWFDAFEDLEGPAFIPLKDDIEMFLHPAIINGVVTWNNEDIDCAPEYMYDHSTLCICDDVSPADSLKGAVAI